MRQPSPQSRRHFVKALGGSPAYDCVMSICLLTLLYGILSPAPLLPTTMVHAILPDGIPSALHITASAEVVTLHPDAPSLKDSHELFEGEYMRIFSRYGDNKPSSYPDQNVLRVTFSFENMMGEILQQWAVRNPETIFITRADLKMKVVAKIGDNTASVTTPRKSQNFYTVLNFTTSPKDSESLAANQTFKPATLDLWGDSIPPGCRPYRSQTVYLYPQITGRVRLSKSVTIRQPPSQKRKAQELQVVYDGLEDSSSLFDTLPLVNPNHVPPARTSSTLRIRLAPGETPLEIQK